MAKSDQLRIGISQCLLGDEISSHRLRALSFATRCTDCQTVYETDMEYAERHETDTAAPSRRLNLQP